MTNQIVGAFISEQPLEPTCELAGRRADSRQVSQIVGTQPNLPGLVVCDDTPANRALITVLRAAHPTLTA